MFALNKLVFVLAAVGVPILTTAAPSVEERATSKPSVCTTKYTGAFSRTLFQATKPHENWFTGILSTVELFDGIGEGSPTGEFT